MPQPRCQGALRRALLLAFLLPAAAPPDAQAKRFTLVALPDTQNYAQDYPAVYDSQTQWIVDNRETWNIVFVTHLGDIVNRAADLDQWTEAKDAMDILHLAGVPYGLAMGNHDNRGGYAPGSVDSSCSAVDGGGVPLYPTQDCQGLDYLDHFGPQFFGEDPWYGGASPSGLSNYQTIRAAGLDLLFLHLEVDPRAAELAWAQDVIDAHPNHLVHVTTHRYMYDYRIPRTAPPPLDNFTGGRFDNLVHFLGDQFLYNQTSITADELFDTFIATNQNIFMVHCGHVDAEYKLMDRNDAGLRVYQFLIDFQSFSDFGGNGWMRLVTFDVDEETGRGDIEARTYSPWIDAFRANGDGLDASLQALNEGFEDLRDDLEGIVDVEALEEQLDYWTNTEEGRQEYFGLLYDRGRRDSDFVIEDVDFRAYLLPEPAPDGLGAAAMLGLLLLRARSRPAGGAARSRTPAGGSPDP